MSGTSRVLHSRGLLLVVALFLAACSGTPAVATPTPTTPPGGGTPQPTQPGGATTQPTIGPGQPTPPPGGGGGVFPEGAWQAGTAHVVITGDYSGTVDLALIPFASMSTADMTLFQYGSDAAQTFLSVSIDASSVSIVISTPEYVGGAGTTTDPPCTGNFARRDANAVEAALNCASALVISTSGGVTTGKQINMQVSFTATR